jgi:predicted phosphodiesterase
VFAVAAVATALGQQLTLPRLDGSTRMAVIGDSGTGDRAQYEVAEVLTATRAQFPFEFVIMLGDNIYGRERPDDFRKKFETPYKPLLDAGVTFHATLGNHDDPAQINYKLFNMDGKRYYTFSRGPAQFFVLDSLEGQLRTSRARWKIAYFHHPIYSSGGRHGSEMDLRLLVEPLFIKYGVDVVFSGHEHFYERVNPQHGIHYFTSGAAAKLRKGNIRKTALTAAGFDDDRSFMLIELTDDQLHFQAIARTGRTVDSGVIDRPVDPPASTESR